MSSKLLSHPAALCNIVRRAAVEAGELILEYFDGIRDMEHISKTDGSPVTCADKEAEKLIEKALYGVFADIPVVGEESFANGKRINFADNEYFWLVDPLDGTKAFIRGEGDFTVNIALVKDSEPILGVIYAPEKGDMYAGFINEDGSARALRFFEDSNNEKTIRSRKMPRDGLNVMSSNYHGGSAAQDAFLESFKVKKITRQASSLKICAVASGRADIYPRFGSTCEWDTAAGHAILRAAGGDIVDMNGKPLRYGGAHPDLLNPHFIAASSDLLNAMQLNENQ
ncbi:MAG: 3'(2'),5'-bisphosphate nucleotidase CysQ [Alphaproteobacteria bacterium]